LSTVLHSKQESNRIAISLGDPAGIGPDIAIKSCLEKSSDCRVYFTDPSLIAERSAELRIPIRISEINDFEEATPLRPSDMQIYPIVNPNPVSTGRSDPENTEHILECLNSALWHTTTGIADALVTGPINKAVINKGGVDFTGHTEYLARALGVKTPVMMLASEKLRVVLATTHLPLERVTPSITEQKIFEIVNIVNRSLINRFKIPAPKICICGLNPHAGEDGHLGTTDKSIIYPTVQNLIKCGINIIGPIPADTVFSTSEREKYDVIIAMYHDQGLAPLKAVSFGKSVNITLGLPIIRTSVDHGTAYNLAGTGDASHTSFLEAIKIANFLAT